MSDHPRLPFIPVCSATFDGNELAYLTECIETGWVSSSGAFVKKFEEAFAAEVGVGHAITASSGTSALHLALLALGVGPGDEVIIPALTMIATGNAVLYTGATPVIVDVDRRTGNIDPAAVKRAITGRTRAVFAVHLYGLPCPMDALSEICSEHGLALLEDAAEAIGTTYAGKKAGGLGLGGCFSFFANKAITTGEGGMVTTNDDDFAHRVRRFKDQWFIPEKRFFHPQVGYNYRMSNLQAAVGLAQLERVETLVKARQTVAARYNRLLEGFSHLDTPLDAFEGGANSHWMYAVSLTSEEDGLRDRLAAYLKTEGIDSRGYFYPMNEQPAFQEFEADCPAAASLSSRGLLLPTGPTLSEEQQERITARIRSFFAA